MIIQLRLLFKLVFISCLLIQIGNAQIAYYDAIELAKHVSDNKFQGPVDNYIPILKKYLGNEEDWDVAEVAGFYEENPFIKPLLPDGLLQSETTLETASAHSAAGLAGINVTTFTKGLASFLIRRANEELSVAFFDRFKKAVEEQKVLSTLFPVTADFLAILEPHRYSAMLQMLREAFREDLSNLNENLVQVYELEEIQKIFRENPELAVICGAIAVVHHLSNGSTPAEILARFDGTNSADNFQIDPSLLLVSRISQSIRSKTKTNSGWISAADFAKLSKNGNLAGLRVYLGLLYETTRFHAEFNNSLASHSDDFSKISSRFESFTAKADRLKLGIASLHSVSNDTLLPKYLQYYLYYNSALDLMELATEIPEWIQSGSNPTNPVLRRYFKIARQSGELYRDVHENRFSTAVVRTITIYDSTVGTQTPKVRKALVKYGAFIAAVATAESSAQIDNAIAATVLPAGSFTIKRKSPLNISLNAYLGGFLGQERSELISDKPRVYGATAPIGVAISGSKCGYSFSLFASLIDIGAVTAYISEQDLVVDSDDDLPEKINTMPEITLGNIFAPGIYGVVGIKNLPISIGGGLQLGPHTREISSNGEAINSYNGKRISAFFAVDIPLINFYTRPIN